MVFRPAGFYGPAGLLGAFVWRQGHAIAIPSVASSPLLSLPLKPEDASRPLPS